MILICMLCNMCMSYISYDVLTYLFNFKMTIRVMFKITSMMPIAWFVCAGLDLLNPHFDPFFLEEKS